MNDEKVFQLLVEMNPVPDPDGLDLPSAFAELELRSPTMTTEERIATQPTKTGPVSHRNRWRRLVPAATAVIALLVVGLGTWAFIGGSDDDAASGVDVVISSHEALNDGDLDGYLATLTEELVLEEQNDRLAESFINANEQSGFAEPCTLLETSPTGGSAVQCIVTSTNDFYGPAGITSEHTAIWTMDANGKISNVDNNNFDCVRHGNSDCVREGAFIRRFWSWLSSAHPDVYAEIEPEEEFEPPGFERDPANMLIAIEYVDEFVAQSDVYPYPATNS